MDKQSNEATTDPECRPSTASPSKSIGQSVVGPNGRFDLVKVLGNGSFGVVCEVRCCETGQKYAIKKVLQDPRYKNRELDIMNQLCHANIVQLKESFYASSQEEDGARFLNLVMECMPDTVYRVLKSYVRESIPFPPILVKLYTYQMSRSLAYLHSLGICHRDIKPQNLLVSSLSHVVKLCDFGSAKRLSPGEQSVAYICSRFYRAPELMLGATSYTTAIDTWSMGCVLGELLLGRPLFAGETSVDQLVKIINILGTPTPEEIATMNPGHTHYQFPDLKKRDWRKVFGPQPCGTSTDAVLDLLNGFLRYNPKERLDPFDALSHEFFDELRDANTRLPGGQALPPLFNFSDDELRRMSATTRRKLIPAWYQQQMGPCHS